MKFNVDGKQFQQQLQAVSKVINAKNALSILDNFLFTVEGDRLSITGSDQENVMTAYLEVTESECDGRIAINAKRMLEIVKEISNQPLTFKINDDTKEVDVEFLNGHFNFMGVDAMQYPERRATTEAQTMIIPASMVLEGIEHTLYAVAPDNVRPIMTGIFWDIHPEDITFVSSDTHKLVRYINRAKAPGIESSFILPSKPASILKSIIGKEEADIKIEFDRTGARFEFGDYELSCLFINGNYPNYNRVIPQDGRPYEITIDRTSLVTALRRVTLFAAKSSNLVVLKINSNEILINASDMDYGTSAEERITCSYDGAPMTIGFNGVFMIEILNNLSDSTVVLKLSDPGRPGIYTPLQQPENADIVVIQMPMQVL